MLKINLEDTNYRAKIVRLENIKKHPNADKLQIVTIDYNSVITGLDAKEGDIYVYFPLECAINKEFLSWSNSFEERSFNADVNQRGFFNKHGRVCAVKLRGEPSQGYIIPEKVLIGWLQTKFDDTHFNTLQDSEGLEFDSYDDIVICQKYVPATKENNHIGLGKGKPIVNKIKEVLIDGQFLFYGDTEHFKKCTSYFKPDDLVVITQKIHGSSFIGSHVLLKRKLSLLERGLKFFGIQVPENKYGFIWSSGKPKSNLPKGTSEGWVSNTGSYYKENIWKREFDRISSIIPKGYTIYGEIVGHGIQGAFTYHIPMDEISRLYVYKITINNPDGTVHTLDWHSLKEFCTKYNLNYVHELFIGKLSTFGDNIEDIVQNLCLNYLEKDLPDGLPDEGICIQKLDEKKWFKLKSTKFLEWETKELDKEIENIEDEQA